MRSRVDRASLISEFPELSNGDVILQKEVYAHFGLAFFKFALVEHSLINIVTFHFAGEQLKAGLTRTEEQWVKSIDDGERQAIALTFGNLVKKVTAIEEFVELSNQLSQTKKLRDYFAHHFMREEAALFSSDEGCWFALEKIAEIRNQTLELEESLKPKFSVMCARYRIRQPSEDQLNAMTQDYLAERNLSIAEGSAKMGWEDEKI